MPARRYCPLLVVFFAAACAQHRPVPSAPPPAPRLAPVPGLRVLLIWDAPVDLDLYVTDPTSESAYFANTPTRSGVRLVRDARCADIDAHAPPYVEDVQMAAPLAGGYRVGIDFIDHCTATDAPVSFRVVVEMGGAHREATGTIRLEQFQPIVLEFELQPLPGNGPLVLSPEG